jgi:DNA primase
MNLERTLNINKKFAVFCKETLARTSDVRDYVHSRIDPKIATAFNIGFCDDKVIDFLQEHDFSEEELDRLGLIASDADGDYYPVFLNRILVPIFTTYGIVGFSGRCYYPSQQKYINTKKTLLYNKSDLLYPMAFSKKYIAQKQSCVLVEGYFDALALIAAGIRNVVALCGTALSISQVNQIKRWAPAVRILLDGDDAGRASARKIHSLLLENRVDSSIITLPDKFDPDTFIKERGSEELNNLLED